MAPVCPRDGDCGATGKGGACTGCRWEGADLAAPGSVWREAGRQAAAHHGRHVPYLYNAIGPTGHHQSPGSIHGHVGDVMFSFMKGC